MDKTRESARLEVEESFPDSCGPRKLSATFLHGRPILASLSCKEMLPSLDARGKSRGSGLESRKTRLKVTGRGTRKVAAAAAWEERGRHASSDHGKVRDRPHWTPKGQI
ncbi:hypothetical protein CRG98_037889 [Punica granatum]|uniref:Uncharacterized protein n=1 Tax=Punica granatum TaxID=22663 RepID=A0A2I0ID42_PUNGR|nr:hypothetical protein CRG98_037889 [Punica granatum]